MVLLWFADPKPTQARLLAAAAVTVLFAIGAWAIRGVTTLGAVAGGLVSFILYVAAGPGAFLVLLTIFLLTWWATRIGYSRKQQFGTAERSAGRNASQVAANLYAAGVLAAASVLTVETESLITGAIAVLAEVAADTVSSELGQAVSARAYLITNFETVPVGTDGAVSLPGSIAGMMSALLVAGVAAGTKVVAPRWVVVITAAAVLGMLLDSVLGATLERSGKLNNDGVNAISTLSAGLLGTFAAILL